MYESKTQVRVRYAETDQMGYVYYGNYATYFEVARVEALRALGMTYKDLEDNGVMMPVLENHSIFLKPGKYDELLTLNVHIKELPGVKIRFHYEIFNEGDNLIHKGTTLLAFVNMQSGRPCKCPESMYDLLRPFFNETA